MKYKSDYKHIIKKVPLPSKLDDNYVENRTKFQEGKSSYTIEYGWGICGKNLSNIDLTDLNPDSFRKLSFDERTAFSKEQQAKFNPNILLEKGKSFGLGLDKLHDIGLDGSNINVAIIDWSFDYNNMEMINKKGGNKVELYDDSRLDRRNKNDDGFHAKTVSSLFVGNTVGVAPGSKLFYFAINQMCEDSEISDILDKIKDLNTKGANIQVVSMSSSLADDKLNEKHTKELQEQNCAFISSANFWQQDFNYMCRNNYNDINDFNNFDLENSAKRDFSVQRFINDLERVKNSFDEREKEIETLYLELEDSGKDKEGELLNKIRFLSEEQSKIKPYLNMPYQDFINTRETKEQKSIYIPCGGRTYPQIGNDGKYMYCGHASTSWTIPQIAGIFAISRQLDPSLSFQEFSEISRATAAENDKGYLVINPEGLIREINDRNKMKAEINEEYKKVYSISQEYISKFDNIKCISFDNTLKSMINNEICPTERNQTQNKKDDKVK